MSSGMVGHLLEWRQHKHDGRWRAWISWVETAGDPLRYRHLVTEVPAGSVTPLEAPDAYARLPRTVFGRDGEVRPWAPLGSWEGEAPQPP